METRRTPWHEITDGPWCPECDGGGYVAYRIWVQQDGHRWHQRHEWRMADGTIELDPWIPGLGTWGHATEIVND